MSDSEHTYGPTCNLSDSTANEIMRRASSASESAPKVKAHFFYTSALPIDDPLSAVPPPTSGSTATASRHPPRPFSAYDNAALEEAWEGLQANYEDHKEQKKQARWWRIPEIKFEAKEKGVKWNGEANESDDKEEGCHDKEGEVAAQMNGEQGTQRSRTYKSKGSKKPKGALNDPGSEKKKVWKQSKENRPGTPRTDSSEMSSSTALSVSEVSGQGDATPKTSNLARTQNRNTSKSSNSNAATKLKSTDESKAKNASAESSAAKVKAADTQFGGSPSESDTTGTLFLRAPTRKERSRSPARDSEGHEIDFENTEEERKAGRSSFSPNLWSSRSESGRQSRAKSTPRTTSENHPESGELEKAFVPVGISRLHLVELPDMRMAPIYWSPVHDISSVIRGTWFYKDTMLPIEADIANQLELGYEELRPWSQTWKDELNSAVEVGAEGEAKVVHRLWPKDDSKKTDSRPTTATTTDAGPSPMVSKATKATAASGEVENKAAGSALTTKEVAATRNYRNSSVIYANAKDAYILRPSLLPSAYYSQKPLAAIRKGKSVGVSVTRNFDYKAWKKLHPSKTSPTISKAKEGAYSAQSRVATSNSRKFCSACLADDDRPQVTDLILVIHGIGQKLSERVESYHFTHAINAFRRQVNVELGTDAVKSHLRESLGGLMVLPINWRSTLSFEDGGPPPTENNENDPSKNQYSLKDITPETIPAVRNLISDVMLDIPYYLSHHKSRMIRAVIKEANRVYRLWCRNNPGFHETGRVHLIAHSLGSVMALDILSKQPTKLSKQLDLGSKKINDEIFEFNTKSLFFCGSPAGFFILLNRGRSIIPQGVMSYGLLTDTIGKLLPRKGRDKPGADGDEVGTSEAGTYGCLAVDNIYNVMNYNDPIAYRLNATVDADYASSLKTAAVPSSSTGYFESLGNIFKAITPSSSSSSSQKPNMARLPSTIEMERHDFTREEIAEKRFFKLNENGQIDYFLSSGGGPLEIQYLNMLGAHSSYWISRDFVRFLVVEVGREGGRENTLASMRAVKRAHGK
ncbi:MAG: hypothetical protein M1827_002516 [Pycnora praestabilis]|nr:MAG: hypothetical protein M1827_002516 [Pycnora praestabilis]